MAWNASKNTVFFQRVVNTAALFQDLRDEVGRLTDIWIVEDVVNDPAYIGTTVDGIDITKNELNQYMSNVLQDYTLFIENGVVASKDRVDYIAKLITNEE